MQVTLFDTLNQKLERHIRSGTHSNRESVGILTGQGLVQQTGVLNSHRASGKSKIPANYRLSVSIKLLYGLYRLGTSPILSKLLYGSLQVLHSLELNKAFDHIKPSTADESTNLTSLETDIGLSVQLSYILPLN